MARIALILLLLVAPAYAAPVTLQADDMKGMWVFAADGVRVPVRWLVYRTYPDSQLVEGLTKNGSLLLAIYSTTGLVFVSPGTAQNPYCLRFSPDRQVAQKRLSGTVRLQDANCSKDLGVYAPFKAWKR